ncbi:linear amide C-N hydrolase [Parapusillimonas granuli]|uniref:Linear amide C-N hydrolase n=1 Tax=Parapusillimonas granuli TaxID=380911 RepID=A0A853FVH9_9BURK|nr:linear amide C-N hydrolase [Parapusillimonas granuli]MBB5215358.1 choloylglycine hydrolase [Parapusillimonas granuli]NYT49975.1 linear amide C-N hydrolase [Parapusillimonas granuli]
MIIRTGLQRTLIASVLATALTLPGIAYTCTSLLYTDAQGAPYSGRTMELPMELPYQATYFPAGTGFGSKADHHPVLSFQAKYGFVSVTTPDPLTKDLKVLEGLNEHGLSFSLLAFASTEGPKDMTEKTHAVLAAVDLGAWTLSQFKNVEEVKAALRDQTVLVTALLPLGVLKTPFHYTLHDAGGASIVIEFANGKQQVIDNPLGVMTNGPEFSWHMTNLNNYTFLSNKDQSKLELNGLQFAQPDSGIATAALPASNTSVGRFVRAVYYSQFAEKAKTPEQAVSTLSHVMNNFDRPRGITMDERFEGAVQDAVAPGVAGHSMYTTEYTSWTALSDLRRLRFSVRSYESLNYIDFDLAALLKEKSRKTIALSKIPAGATDGAKVLLAAD